MSKRQRSAGSDGPGVAVWCSTWLGTSETFVRNQVEALRSYRPFRTGLCTIADPLVRPDYAPFAPDSFRARVVAGAMHRGVVPRAWTTRAEKHEVDVVHAHYGPGGVVAQAIASRWRVPLVVTFHGYDVTSLPAADAQYRAHLERLFSSATVLIAVSHFIAERLIDLGAPPAKIRIHYIGIPISPPPSVREDRHGIAFVGRFTEKKGIDDLLAATALLPEQLRRTPIRLAGFGELEPHLRATAETLQLDARFLGSMNSDDVAMLLASSAVFVAPSKTAGSGDAEGLGMVFLEAGLAELPVVSYRHGGVSEAVADGVTGVLAPEGDVEALSSALEHVLTNPHAARSMGAAGRRRVLDSFDVSANTAQLELLYDEARSLYADRRR